MEFIERPSPNCDDRELPVSMIVLHYTGMPDAEGALDRLTSPEAKVSAHYLVDEDGSIYRLVDESKRAWHSGRSRWRGANKAGGSNAYNSPSLSATASRGPDPRCRNSGFPCRRLWLFAISHLLRWTVRR